MVTGSENGIYKQSLNSGLDYLHSLCANALTKGITTSHLTLAMSKIAG